MTKFESVLTQALDLADDEREILMIRLGLSLPAPSRMSEHALIAELDALSDKAAAYPESLVDWADAECQIFGTDDV